MLGFLTMSWNLDGPARFSEMNTFMEHGAQSPASYLQLTLPAMFRD
jgi:hypothetical protein